MVESHQALILLRPGIAKDSAINRLEAEIQAELVPTALPSVVGNLQQIGSTPWLLAGFLVVLGVAGLAHALASGTRRYFHDLAVTRALGFRPAQVAAAVYWQAVVLAVSGALIGLAVGVLVGRLTWRVVAEGSGALLETTMPEWALLVVPAGAVVVALAAAAIPAAQTARARPGEILRTE